MCQARSRTRHVPTRELNPCYFTNPSLLVFSGGVKFIRLTRRHSRVSQIILYSNLPELSRFVSQLRNKRAFSLMADTRYGKIYLMNDRCILVA